MSYILANPYVEGKALQSNKKSANDAAEEIWNELSSNIKQFIPEFFYSIKNTNKDKFHHFKVTETIEGGKVKYTLKQLNKHVDEDVLNQVINTQNGGRKKRYEDSSSSSSESSDSSSDDYIYYPNSKSKIKDNVLSVTYYPTIYGIPNVLIPTFSTTFTPYVNVSLNNQLPTVISFT